MERVYHPLHPSMDSVASQLGRQLAVDLRSLWLGRQSPHLGEDRSGDLLHLHVVDLIRMI